jgi:8-oxo-dGTP pyrophosphatase MutT (NUDIX family)
LSACSSIPGRTEQPSRRIAPNRRQNRFAADWKSAGVVLIRTDFGAGTIPELGIAGFRFLSAAAYYRFIRRTSPSLVTAGGPALKTICMSGTQSLEIVPLERAEIMVEPWQWEFAVKRRGEIDRHFAARRQRQPALWNGRVLLLKDYRIENGVLSGSSFETDFASFMSWRDWDFPDRGVFNVFSMAAVRAADGGYLIGEMADHTASAGQLYFPCGTPDPQDIAAGMLDLDGSAGRELFEETGIDIDTLAVRPGWSLVRERNFLALIKQAAAAENARELRARVMRHLASVAQPEFSDIRIVRERADLTGQIPAFVVAFLESVWRGKSRVMSTGVRGGR